MAAQSIELDIFLADIKTKQPIPDAHVFIANTTIGTVSDKKGNAVLKIPHGVLEKLIVTHLSYESLHLDFFEYSSRLKTDTIYLKPGTIAFEEVLIVSENKDKRNKYLKEFKSAFFGDDKQAEKCSLLNPEAISFIKNDDLLKATSSQPLKIENDYLGYKIDYDLEYLTITEDGSVEYLGTAYYKDFNKERITEDHLKNRENSYYKSPQYFFKSLVEGTMEENGFEIELVSYQKNKFISIETPEISELLSNTIDSNTYEVSFQEFLKITDKSNKSVDYESQGVRMGGLESQRFSLSGKEQRTRINYATSYLYKISPSIVINRNGNVLNSRMIKEYGYWAEKRFAHQLPYNFGGEATANEKSEPDDQGINRRFTSDIDKLELLRSLIKRSSKEKLDSNILNISSHWENGFIPPLIEILRLSNDVVLNNQINILLQIKTGQTGIQGYFEWLEWLWNQESLETPYYYEFKGEIYSYIDIAFEKYFKGRSDVADIRLDEIVWGGVKQNGIPPLRYPKMVAPADAGYLDRNDIVFGVYIEGNARAYPKRILAWHEFVIDSLAKKNFAGVYCTLCGTVIIYDLDYQDIRFNLGTSGFLYRSNKLMFDEKTNSLWSTLQGKPVVGPLIDHGVELNIIPVVTTTWGEWKSRHPGTKVLSIETGYERDYREGEAYKDYFGTDELMFPVPMFDSRLQNKDEVLIVRASKFYDDPIAISIEYLKKNKWYHSNREHNPFVVVSDKKGTSRVYAIQNVLFKDFKKGKLIDESGKAWQIKEDYLLSPTGRKLERIPSHNSFWFAWYNLFPHTQLVH